MATTIESWPVTMYKGGTAYPVVNATYSNVVNQGIQWSCELPDDSVGWSWDETTSWTLQVGTWTSPALTAYEAESKTADGSGPMTIGGVDLTTHKLATEGISMATFSNYLADDIIDAIAARALATVAYLGSHGLDGLRVQEYDVQGGVIGEHIVRLLRDAACNYRINASGAFEVFPIDYTAYTTPVVGSTSRKRDLGGKYTQIWANKQSKAKGVFEFQATKSGLNQGDMGPAGLMPGSLSVALKPGAAGAIAYAAFYSEAGGAGLLCALMQMDPTFSIPVTPTPGAALPALSCVYAVEPAVWGARTDVTLVVRGTPPTDGGYTYDSAFSIKSPDPDTATRPRHLVVESPVWPTQTWMTTNSIAAKLLWEANKGNDTVSRIVKFDPTILPGLTIAADSDAPKARYDSVSWQAGSGGCSMTLNGFVVPW